MARRLLEHIDMCDSIAAAPQTLPPQPRVGRLAPHLPASFARAWSRLRGFHVAAGCAAVITLACALLPPAALVHRVFFDRTELPDIEAFVRFEIPTTGEVRDAQGGTLIEMAHQYRRLVTYDQLPQVLREAILSAEDKNFFVHSGVDFGVLPRVFDKGLRQWLSGLRSGSRMKLQFAQGGSTLTQQLVRGFFLPELMRRENGQVLVSQGLLPRALAMVLGVPATNKLARKLEEVRLSLWLEEEMQRRYGSRQQAKREILARYASLIYLGNGRYGFAAGSEYYFGLPLASYSAQDAAKAAMLASIVKAPGDYAPVRPGPRPLRRRNAVLALMAGNGYISSALMTRCQAEPIRLVARPDVKTLAPAAIDGVVSEIKLHGGSRFGIEDLFQGRIAVRATVDERIQAIVNQALEGALLAYEKRHPRSKGQVQGSVVVLRNRDAAILAEAGGRAVYNDRQTRYSDYNRATDSLRQPGSAMKPLVYLAAFRAGLALDSIVPDEPIAVPMGSDGSLKWIANYDELFKGPIPVRLALAESRNAVAIWITRTIGIARVTRLARELGIHTPLKPYPTTALGASEVRLLELANAYRAMASGRLADPYVIERVTDATGAVLYQATARSTAFQGAGLQQIQEGLRGVIRLPTGTAHSLDGPGFPIPVMGKTGTSSDFRDALFIGSTYGVEGLTVGVRVGFDDNRMLGSLETGGRAALPVFREVMLRVYQAGLVGPVPTFPREVETAIDGYLVALAPEVPSADPVLLLAGVSPIAANAAARPDLAAR